MRHVLPIVCALAGLFLMGCASEESNRIKRDSAFSECRVDFGIVVSDLDESAAFYTDALGLTEVGGFSVPATMGGDSGLSDYKPFRVRVFKIDGLANATQVKLMEFPAENPKPIDNEYIHSSLGVSYLTLYVNDMDQAVARARRAGVEPVAKGPIDLPEGFPDGIYLALVRDPDGNLIEFVGPKASE